MNDKKISEIAKELNLSRQSVYKRVSGKLHPKLIPYIVKNEVGTILIKPKGVAIIKESYESNLVKPDCQSDDSKVDNKIQFMYEKIINEKDLIIAGKTQDIAWLKEQLQAKDQQIETLTLIHQQAQALHRQDQLLIEASKPKGFKNWFNKSKKGDTYE